MAVPTVNIQIEQGADFATTYTITNSDGSVYDLNGASAVAKVKKYPGASSSSNMSTSLIASTGKIQVSLANTVTAVMDPGRYYYDILVTDSGNKKTRVIEGQAIVTPGNL